MHNPPTNQSPFTQLETVGVITTNSVGYVETMLQNLAAGLVSVPLRSADDTERMARTQTTKVMSPPQGSGWAGLTFTSRPGPEPALVSFTSGTEGPPKAVLLSRTNLHDPVERLTDAMEITSEIREYIAVPVHHSFGYCRCRVVLNAGGDCWLPQRGFDLSEIRQMLVKGQINAISAVPSQWRVFLQNLDLFGKELAAVRWVEIGSQYMSADEKLRLREALPEARIVQHYGLTEASRAALLRIHAEPVEALEAVGRAEGRTALRINARGRIELNGPHVAMAIDNGSSCRKLTTEDWLETNDLGRIEDGLLYFMGRNDDVINCAGIKLSPDMVENQVRRHLSVQGDFGVLRTPDPLRGDGILVVTTPATTPTPDVILETVRNYARSLGLDPIGSVSCRIIESLPRTATGKLQRRELTEQLSSAPAAPDIPPPSAPAVAGSDKQGLAVIIDELLGHNASSSTQTFLDFGADSLTHLQLSLALERIFGTTPDEWEAIALSALVAQAESAEPLEPEGDGHFGAPPLPRGNSNMNPADISFWALVREDYLTNDASLAHQGFLMLLVHRFGNWRMDIRWRLLRAPLTIIYRIFNKLTQILFGMKLDYTVKVGRRVKLEHFGGMILGARAIGNDVILRQNTTLGIRSTEDLKAKPIIGNFVDIGAGAVIVGDITIGDNSIIGANSVVYTNVPSNSVVVGVPGRIIGQNLRQNPSPLPQTYRTTTPDNKP